MSTIKQITELNPNVQLVVTASDLRQLFEAWQQENRAQQEAVRTKASTQQSTLLTAKEVGKMLRVSASTLWKLEKQGKLVPVRIGRRVFYHQTDVEAISHKKEE